MHFKSLVRNKPGKFACLLTSLCVLTASVFSLSTAVIAADAKRIASVGARLVGAYPDHLAGVERNELIWKDGTRMPIDDGIAGKDFQTRLNNADLEDQFYVAYPKGNTGTPPPELSDPGRVRYEPFFRKMYGDCKQPGFSSKYLADVVWLPTKWGRKIRVSKINGIDKKLQAVSNELDKLDGRFTKYMKPIGGTFACRTIAGTNRRSMHAYATAVDIAVKYAHYWRWAAGGPSVKPVWRNRIPLEIVRVFERHGFIWGGKWYHYDTMHFEYRPELLTD